MTKWKVAFLVMASASLAGCWQGDYAFEGKYYFSEGEECNAPSSASDREQYLIEITKEVRNGTALYSARFPIAAKLGAPIASVKSVSATDDNALTFEFAKPEVSGMFSGSASLDIVLTVKPNKSKEGHLWMTKAAFTSARDGKVIERDFLETFRNAGKIGKTGACLGKGSATLSVTHIHLRQVPHSDGAFP
ncbi:hypothetical protein BZK31_14890 [Pseudomonas floridensis]|uniref:Lipoprotein n=1 Tax=Pseudomonas floridensis TaxID=1958950 RepID=A0A1X0N4T6_9PSED|nr:hypothetical protein [Pseudomonas floridensis]ORC58561.1 hypothetical protein BZK31_14890 [Pseudomonas floridensis]